MKKEYLLIFFGFLIPILVISSTYYSLNKKTLEYNVNKSIINFDYPFILDSKAILKSQYLNLSNYGPFLLSKCLISNLKECKNPNIYITAYLYKKADKNFCNSIHKPFKIGDFIIEDNLSIEKIRNLCNLLYKLKTNNLTEKDCIGKFNTEFCSYYFENKYDFIKANLQFYELLHNPENIKNCLTLEEPVAYYCLKIKNISCENYEDPKSKNKCYELLVIPDKNYSEFLNKVKGYLFSDNWKNLENLVKNTNNPELIHSLARLGVLNGSYCKVFLNKSLKQYQYCLKRFYNQRFLCEFSNDKRQCYFFDVILNNKSCDLLKDPQEKTDCELFKKYINKKDCNFFYTVGSNEYLGYLCAIYKKNCSGQFYYDKMYQLICKKLLNETKNQ